MPSASASRHSMMERMASGLSQMPPIMVCRPASIRLAMAISPSRDSSSTLPISRRYMRTGSSVRPRSSSSTVAGVVAAGAASGCASSLLLSSDSSLSMTLMPISESIVIVSSICSEFTSSDGSALLSSS